MDVIEHLIMCLAEEAGEIVQAAGKTGRFGPSDKPPGGGLPNNEYIVAEVNDLLSVLELLQEEGMSLPGIGNRTAIDKKKEKVKRFMDYANECGRLI